MNPPRVFTDEEMNLLQQNGVISDNCIQSEDVADADRSRAEKWLALWVKSRGFADEMELEFKK